jgi:glycosyltransferase involved in cell wall biosynthesis
MATANRSIVFINQATGYLTIDIVNAFVASQKFSKVALIAGSIRVQDILLDPSVEWTKVVLYNRGNPRRKFISWLLGTLQIGWWLATRFRKFEVFYITIPPFAYLWSLILPNRFSILVFDVYPDVLKIYNISEKNIFYRMWSWSNKRLFKKAHQLYTVGEGIANVLKKYVVKESITIIPNWPGLTNIKRIDRNENFFLKEHNLQNKFVVQYSGNIGYTHNVEVLLTLAELMKEHTDIFFLIIGRGERYTTIKQHVEEGQVSNCKVLPFQPDNILNYTLSGADLGVVLLDDKTAHVSIPSKIYNLQAVGVPILGIADTTSELALHLKKYNTGKCFDRADLTNLCDYILEVKQDLRKMNQLKNNATRAAKEFTSANAFEYVKAYV